MGDFVQYEKRGNVGIFTLNRPRAKNAINASVSAQMEKLLDAFEADDSVWVGIMYSALPDVFSAGADLKAINAGENISSEKGGFAGIVKYPRTKPMIAAVEGQALASLILHCWRG